MELQWQRRVERWLSLMGAAHLPAGPRMTLTQGSDTLYLEQLNGRALVTAARVLSEVQRACAMERLLALSMPEATGGVPLRAWAGHGRLWLAATAPAESGAEAWYALGRSQLRLLTRVTEGVHASAE